MRTRKSIIDSFLERINIFKVVLEDELDICKKAIFHCCWHVFDDYCQEIIKFIIYFKNAA